jgi:hypothetical protein
MNGKYAKEWEGERLCYQDPRLPQYEGKDFCLRITLGHADLGDCFFVYLPCSWENLTIGDFFCRYFQKPTLENKEAILKRLDLAYDPELAKRYCDLIQAFASSNTKKIDYHINQGPSYLCLEDTIHQHLGTSIWTNGQHDDKILDIVLEFQHISEFLKIFPENKSSAAFDFCRETLILYFMSQKKLQIKANLELGENFKRAMAHLNRENRICFKEGLYKITDQGIRYIHFLNQQIAFWARFSFLRYTSFDPQGNPHFEKAKKNRDLRIPFYEFLVSKEKIFEIVFLLELASGAYHFLSLKNMEEMLTDEFWAYEFAFFLNLPPVSDQEKNFLQSLCQEMLQKNSGNDEL